MGLFSFSRKNKQEPSSGASGFYSRPDEESTPSRSRAKRKENQTNDPVDPVLPEKKRARRRLVGAIALVLAAVIGLPMIFDSEPKPVADDITIQIPSKDKPADKGSDSMPAASKIATSASLDPKEEIIKTSNGSAGMATAMVAAGAVSATAAVAKNKESDKQSDPAKTAATDGKSDDKAQSTEVKPEAKQMVKTGSNAEQKMGAKSTASVEQKLNEASKDKVKKSAVSSEGGKATTDKSSGKFMLQVAALMTREKINELQGKLKKAGFTTSTQKIATEAGVSTRIRVGPYATKEETEKARAKLGKIGLNGTLVSR